MTQKRTQEKRRTKKPLIADVVRNEIESLREYFKQGEYLRGFHDGHESASFKLALEKNEEVMRLRGELRKHLDHPAAMNLKMHQMFQKLLLAEQSLGAALDERRLRRSIVAAVRDVMVEILRTDTSVEGVIQ